MQTPSDEELVRRARDGDQRAFAELYRRHAPLVLVRLRRVLGRDGGAEDVLQEVFIQVSRKLDQYQPQHAFGAWLHGFAFHIAGRQLRSRRRKWWLSFGGGAALDQVQDTVTKSPERQVMGRQLTAHLYKAMDNLNATSRIAFALHELDGLGVTEIGQMLNMSPQAVFGRVERARKQVLKQLRKLGEEHDVIKAVVRTRDET